MKATAKKKHPPSPKLLAHLKRLNLSRRKKAKVKKPAKPAAKAATRKKPKKAPAPKPVTQTASSGGQGTTVQIPPVELPKGDAPGQTTMPVVDAAVAACGCGDQPAPAPAPAASGEELL